MTARLLADGDRFAELSSFVVSFFLLIYGRCITTMPDDHHSNKQSAPSAFLEDVCFCAITVRLNDFTCSSQNLYVGRNQQNKPALFLFPADFDVLHVGMNAVSSLGECRRQVRPLHQHARAALAGWAAAVSVAAHYFTTAAPPHNRCDLAAVPCARPSTVVACSQTAAHDIWRAFIMPGQDRASRGKPQPIFLRQNDYDATSTPFCRLYKTST